MAVIVFHDRRHSLASRALQSPPVFNRDGPTFVIAPASADFQVTRRVSFLLETGAPDQRNGRGIPGLYVRFETVQFDLPERVAQHELQPLAHVTTIGKRRSGKITKIGTAEWTEEDLVQHHRADDGIVLIAADKKTDRPLVPNAGQNRENLLVRLRRRRKPAMKCRKEDDAIVGAM